MESLADIFSALSVASLIGLISIYLAWRKERHDQLKEHDERIRWRTQTDDRLRALESSQQTSEERMQTRVDNLQSRIDDRWSTLESKINEHRIHLHALQNDVKRIEVSIAEIQTTLKSLLEKST